jgi:ankyrin repeat protein
VLSYIKMLYKGTKATVKLLYAVIIFGILFGAILILKPKNIANENVRSVVVNSIDVSDSNFLDTVKSGDAEKLQLLIDMGINPNSVDEIGRNAFAISAIFNRNPKFVKILKEAGVDINKPDAYGYTPLMMAIISGNNDKYVDAMIKEGADVNSVNNSGASILMVMSGTMDNEKIMENVIKNGAKVNYINKDNVSAIMIAAKISKNPEILKLLIKYGADKKAKDSLGISVYEILKSNPNLKNNQELLNLLK